MPKKSKNPKNSTIPQESSQRASEIHAKHHDHDHDEPSHYAANSSRKILTAFLLNLFFSIVEFTGGVFTGSVAIASDAVHDLGDAISIGIAYFLERYSRKGPDDRYSYGYIRYSVMGSLMTTLILIIGSTIVICGSIYRLFHPAPINYDGMIILAIFGVIVNFAAVYFTRDGESLNQKSVNLHMLEDVLGWVIVLIGAILMRFTDLNFIDSLLSILVAIFILVSALKNLKTVIDIFLVKTPASISIQQLRQQLLTIPDVKDVHHIHVWSLDSYKNFATLHVVTDQPSDRIKPQIRADLARLGIEHATIELESPSEACSAHECRIEAPTSARHHHRHH